MAAADATIPPMSRRPLFRLHAPSSGAEILHEAEPGKIYVDRASGERLEVVGQVLPAGPTASRLPWAIDNLRFCDRCDQLAQKDLNDCPTCGRRMGPIAA